MRFYDKINLQLELQNRSRKQMCEDLKLPYSSITSMFNRKSRSIDMEVMESMASYLGVSMDYLILDDVVDPDYGKLAPATNEKKLSKDEQRLLDSYRELNDVGKEKALGDIEDLTHITKYTIKKSDTFVELSEELA